MCRVLPPASPSSFFAAAIRCWRSSSLHPAKGGAAEQRFLYKSQTRAMRRQAVTQRQRIRLMKTRMSRTSSCKAVRLESASIDSGRPVPCHELLCWATRKALHG